MPEICFREYNLERSASTPLQVSDLDTLLDYFSGVMSRTHHAPNVDAIALALLGAVLWKKDEDSPIEVCTYAGSPANVLWVQIAGQRYALAYNHNDGCIELRERTSQGNTRYTFTNDTSVNQVIFKELKPTA
jgi:hypothetical protein